MRDLINRIDAAITELEEIRTLILAMNNEEVYPQPQWADYINAVMMGAGNLPLATIYHRIKRLRLKAGQSWTCNSPATIRRTLQERCVSVERGVWRLAGE